MQPELGLAKMCIKNYWIANDALSKPLVEKHTKPNSLYDRFSLVFRSVQKFTI